MNQFTAAINHMPSLGRIAFIAVCLAFSSLTIAQKIIVVTVNAQGYGATKAEALEDAVVNGIAQVNGEAVASSMKMQTKDFASTDGTEVSSRSIEESISRKTKGVVRSWRQLELIASGSGDFNASVEVNVVVLKKSAQLKRLKLRSSRLREMSQKQHARSTKSCLTCLQRRGNSPSWTGAMRVPSRANWTESVRVAVSMIRLG